MRSDRAAELPPDAMPAFETAQGGRGRFAPATPVAAGLPEAGSRDAAICSRYLSGETLTSIGESLSLSVEGVRKIARRYGLDKTNAGLAVRRQSAGRPRKVKPAWERVYGCTLLEFREATDEERRVYLQHRTNAKRKDIAWSLTLSQWVQAWRRSGKWAQRGQGPQKYGMTRIDPSRGLIEGNVRICKNLLALKRAQVRREAELREGRGMPEPVRPVAAVFPA
ncbi:MAG TPA: hypothetical protein VHA15_15770 [Burkholderiales bacterium]|jgi:hypothetical protein|nr:hypothetical protein [Burkholderiales bacterium]